MMSNPRKNCKEQQKEIQTEEKIHKEEKTKKSVDMDGNGTDRGTGSLQVRRAGEKGDVISMVIDR